MRITFTIPDTIRPGELAWLVKCLIEGAARGWAVPFRRVGMPHLYDTDVRFAYEPNHGTGNEEFADPFTLLARGEGDCDDLVMYRLTEREAARLPPNFDPTRDYRPGCRTEWRDEELHVQVRHPDRSIEDPAKELGAP